MRLRALVAFFLGITCLAGCHDAPTGMRLSEPETGLVFGGPSSHELFEPYQGVWKWDKVKFEPADPNTEVTGGPDITIKGHIIRSGAQEFRLCLARKAEQGVVCEAWHHEDIDDPGDMSRADCELVFKGEQLEFRHRIVGAGDFSDDPIIASAEYVAPERRGPEDRLRWWVETYSRKNSK